MNDFDLTGGQRGIRLGIHKGVDLSFPFFFRQLGKVISVGFQHLFPGHGLLIRANVGDVAILHHCVVVNIIVNRKSRLGRFGGGLRLHAVCRVIALIRHSFDVHGHFLRREKGFDQAGDLFLHVFNGRRAGCGVQENRQHQNQGDHRRQLPHIAEAGRFFAAFAHFLSFQYVFSLHAAQNVQQFHIRHTNPSSVSCAYSRLRIRNSMDLTLLTVKPDFSAISSVESRYQ